MYSVLRWLLFSLDAEVAHNLTLRLGTFFARFAPFEYILKKYSSVQNNHWQIPFVDLTLKNPLGLAAGMDKNATALRLWDTLGFGFVEVGTITPKPQKGNLKPRLFRLKYSYALINRMGFNNDGVHIIAERIKKYRKTDMLIGANIGKNKNTPNDRAADDYSYCFEVLYPFVDYFTLNVSSPNTPNLRQLQEICHLENILNRLKKIKEKQPTSKPIFIKIAPDLTHSQLEELLGWVQKNDIQGIIATNTTLQRNRISEKDESIKNKSGGLSGLPVKELSNEILRFIAKKEPRFTVVGVGGIMNGADALEKMKIGTDAVQIYTGLIFRGPKIIKEILSAYKQKVPV